MPHLVWNGVIIAPGYDLITLCHLAEFCAMRDAFKRAREQCKFIREIDPKAILEVTVYSGTRYASSFMAKLNHQRNWNQPLDPTTVDSRYRGTVMELTDFADELRCWGAHVAIYQLDHPDLNWVARRAVAGVLDSELNRPAGPL